MLIDTDEQGRHLGNANITFKYILHENHVNFSEPHKDATFGN